MTSSIFKPIQDSYAKQFFQKPEPICAYASTLNGNSEAKQDQTNLIQWKVEDLR